MNNKEQTGIYWCKECKIPLINKNNIYHLCPICKSKINYMCSDARPVFPEERLFLETTISQPLKFKNCSVCF